MIHHIVCFRFKPGTPEARIERAGAELRDMPHHIPAIRGLAWGPNLAPNAAEWSHILVVRLDDMEAVNAYAAHPAHLRVVNEFLAPIRDARLAVDLDVPG